MNEENVVGYLYQIAGEEISLRKEPPTEDDYASVESGDLEIIRFRIYTPEAAAVSGKLGVFERMICEGVFEDAEEGEEEDIENEQIVTWTVEWEQM